MTSLDLILKNMIFSSPCFYPTTWQCYASIFLDVNSGFTFNHSEIQCPFEVNENPVINEEYLELYKTLAVNEIGELNYGMKLFMHDFIKENIDVIVNTKCVYVEYLKPSLDDLSLLVDESPLWLVDASYPVDVLKAAIDVLENVKHLLWHHYGLHHCLTRPIDSESWRKVCYHTAYVKVSERLETLKPERIPA